jgi:dihydroorotate dehydrogenase
MYKNFLRHLFFKFDPETMHSFVGGLVRFAYRIPPLRWMIRKMYCIEHPNLVREFCGLKFSNPVGLSAGFDKNGTLFRAFSMFGFSFIEVGTVTPKGQIGNPRPRLFRIVEDEALINRMGFNNEGLISAIEQLKGKRPNVIVGGNIGKNTLTSNEDAIDDYVKCFRELYEHVDYFTVNVSCPNVANLSSLQNISALNEILTEMYDLRSYFIAYYRWQHKPIFLKISPDISKEHLNEILDLGREIKLEGIVATNTTTKRDNLSQDVSHIGNGGLSGRPLTLNAFEIVEHINDYTNGLMPIIAVGGIMTPKDAIKMLQAGATLVQIYTGFIYNGPGFVKEINTKILNTKS